MPRLLGWDRQQARGPRAWSCWSGSGSPTAFADRYPAQLSGGQQQRVGVARALAADPPVMLMDEPFSAVDPVVREQLQDEFLRLQGELGKTILFVTHDIDEAIKLGDQVAVLRVGGRLAQFGRPGNLLAHPADDFVADFVGRDRGYRALALPADAPRCRCARRAHGRRWARPPTGADADWVLVVDDERPARSAGSSRAGVEGAVSTETAAPRRHGGARRRAAARRCSTRRCPRRPAAA